MGKRYEELFPKEKMWIANNCMGEKSAALLAIREMHAKIVRYHLSEWLTSKPVIRTHAGKNVEELNFSYIPGGKLKWYTATLKRVWQFLRGNRFF